MFKSSIVKIGIISVLLLLFFMIFGTIYVKNMKNLLKEDTEMHLTEVAQQGAVMAESHFERSFEILHVLSKGILSNPDLSTEQKIAILNQEIVNSSFSKLGYADTAGNAYLTDETMINIADRDYFQSSIAGKEYINSSLSDNTIKDQPFNFIYSVPTYYEDKLTGVLFASYDSAKLSEEINVTFFDYNGISFITTNEGNIVLHPNDKKRNTSIFEQIQEDNPSESLEQFKLELQSNNAGAVLLTYEGVSRYIGYAPLPNYNGWNLISSVPANLVSQKSTQIISQTLIVTVALSLVFIFIMSYILISKQLNESNIYSLAYTDKLTGIGNFNKFFMDATKALEKNNGRKYALIYFDINNFKVINDVFGYGYGDKVLMYTADMLKDQLCNGEVFARNSSDHFSILYEYKDSQQEIIDLVQTINSKMSRVTLDEQISITTVLSTGIYLLRNNETDVHRALNLVNMARSSVKNNQTKAYAFFDEDIRNKLSTESDLQNEINKALYEKEFEVYYQPKYNLKDGTLYGSEALIRWKHPIKGFISPSSFIPLAEKTGLIVDIGRYVFEQVCKDLSEWKQMGVKIHPVSVNLSRVELYQTDLISFTLSIIEKHHVDVGFIEMELTETSALNDLEYTQKIIESYKAYGIKVSMDDFGTGYSSLSCLKMIPFDTLKLDRSFLKDIDLDARSRNIIRSIIYLAKSLNLKVVAEGVETKEQADFLDQAQCDIVQGFYYAKPMQKAEFEMLLAMASQPAAVKTLKVSLSPSDK